MVSIIHTRQDLLKVVYEAASRILSGQGTDQDYLLECKFYTILTGAFSKEDWNLLRKIVEG